jgi:hypothetical protein
MRILELLGANAMLLLAGLGVLPLLGIAQSWRALVARVGLGYLCGLAVGGILAAHLALVRVPFGWPALGVVAALSLAAGCYRLRGTERPTLARPGVVSSAGAGPPSRCSSNTAGGSRSSRSETTTPGRSGR